MSSTGRTTRQLTISLPPEMAAHAKRLAKQEHRTVSELFREAFHVYRTTSLNSLMADVRQVAVRNAPDIHSEDDVERLVRETRARLAGERKTKRKAG